jgi:two-component system, chemotaxis family, response regulator Rcp1
MSSRAINILLVEDNPADVLLTQEALEESKLINCVSIVKDGEEALAYLRKEGKYKGAITPDLVLLDLNLPKKDGREVLKEIKDDPDLMVIPVVILTTSAADEDVLRTYQLHANCYIMKPVDFGQFTRVVQTIECFWFSIVKLPRKEA